MGEVDVNKKKRLQAIRKDSKKLCFKENQSSTVEKEVGFDWRQFLCIGFWFGLGYVVFTDFIIRI